MANECAGTYDSKTYRFFPWPWLLNDEVICGDNYFVTIVLWLQKNSPHSHKTFVMYGLDSLTEPNRSIVHVWGCKRMKWSYFFMTRLHWCNKRSSMKRFSAKKSSKFKKELIVWSKEKEKRRRRIPILLLFLFYNVACFCLLKKAKKKREKFHLAINPQENKLKHKIYICSYSKLLNAAAM